MIQSTKDNELKLWDIRLLFFLKFYSVKWFCVYSDSRKFIAPFIFEWTKSQFSVKITCLRIRALLNENPPLHLWLWGLALRKHAYANILKILQPKMENFQIKKIWYFLYISAQNIDCGYSLEPHRRGGSNEYPQSMFWAEIWKIMYTPLNPSFTI